MSAKFYTLLTDIGAAKLASAAALGVPLKITQMAVGDGGGVLPTPNAQQTKLAAEKRRADLNMLYIDPQNSSQIIAEQVIPETEGGWWIREVGLFDETGALIAVGNCPESYKPQLAEGSGRTQTVRMVLITSSTDNITLKIDPSVVLATRKYVDDKVLELKVYVDELMAAHLAAADPHSQYAPKASPTFIGTPKAPTAAAGNNTTQLATTAFVQAALIALVNGAPATLDTLKEIAAAINNDPNFSATINNALALKAPLVSPALTGTPTAPTAAQTVNNTQIATTAFVKSALAALVGSSPAALDTLNELAAALGNDPNFATTMTNALAGKQPIDNTLTALSGKSVAALLEYLGLNKPHGVQTFTTSGTWTCPENVSTVYLSGCAAGGGGGGGGGAPDASTKTSSSGGGGGAGEAVIKRAVTVVPGTVYNITIGSGGVAGNGGAPAGNGVGGSAGGSTSFGSQLTLSGGGAGGAGSAATGSSSNPIGGGGGVPGGSTGSTGSINSIVPSIGGAGGSGPFGTGGGASRGSTGSGSSAGTGSASPVGSGYGSGGGGGAGTLGATGTAGNNGSAGTNGIMILEW